MKPPLPFLGSWLRLALRLAVCVAGLACMLVTARATVSLSSTSFAADNLPYINADSSELGAALNSAGGGGYYKLRAKFIVPYDPGYYQAIDSVNNNGARLTGSPGAGTFTVQLYWAAYNSSGALQGTGPFYSYTVTVSAPAAGGMGLQGDYFNGANFQTLMRTTASGDHPDYGWGSGGPSGTATDNFSVRWSGLVEPLYSETYTFTTGSDDGMRVYVDNLTKPVAEAYWDHGYYEASGTISLSAGQRYRILVEFFENSGGADARLYWQSARQAREIIPITRLLPPGTAGGTSPAQAPSIVTAPQSQIVNVGATTYFTVVANGSPAPALQWRKASVPIAGATGSSLTLTNVQASDAGSYDVVATNSAGNVTSSSATLTVTPVAGTGTGQGLRGDYFTGTNLVSAAVSRLDREVNFDWGNGAPIAGIGVDNFSVRWSGQVEAPVTGYYTFSTNSDDGVRLWVNGLLIINDWAVHGPTDRFSGAIFLTAGTKSDIKVEFFESGGGAVARLYWQPPGQARTIIPGDRLYSASIPPAAAWQTLITESGALSFTEDVDEEGNPTGSYSSSSNNHVFTAPSRGTVRVYTTGNSRTIGWLFDSAGNFLEWAVNSGGAAGNFRFEHAVNPGPHTVVVAAEYQWVDPADYTVYVEFQASATAPVINSPLSAAAPFGTPFTYRITAANDPASFAASGLPAGLSLAASGVISGTPTQAGTFSVAISATNSGGTDTKQLSLTIHPPPACAISASATNVAAGQPVTLTVAATAAGGNLQFVNVDQVSPNAGYYGVGDTGTELPPNNTYYPSPSATAHTRTLTLTLRVPGTYVFRGAVCDGIGWYYSPAGVSVTVTAANYTLTVQNGSGSGMYPAGTSVAINAIPPPGGSTFTAWSLLSGSGNFANAAASATTFQMSAGNAVVQANYITPSPPTITASPVNQILASGQTATFSVTASGASPLSYQWRKAGVALSDGGNVSGAHTASLSLTAITSTDAAAYDVVVSNSVGSAISPAATLSILPAGDDGSPQLRLHRSF